MVAALFPGQGSQSIGMGKFLFDRFDDLTRIADEVLGYPIKRLCLEDPYRQLSQTQYTQPALYVVEVMTWLDTVNDMRRKPDYLAGHSVGEYAALFAAGVFDFQTGLKLVQKRAQLMSGVTGGAMAAVVGLTAERVAQILRDDGLEEIDIANENTLLQIVIAGPKAQITAAGTAFERANAKLYMPLNVSGAFHSRYMNDVAEKFGEFARTFDFASPRIPVLSNYTGQPHAGEALRTNITRQINHRVRWAQGVRLLLERGEVDFLELGPGNVLTEILRHCKEGR